MSSSPSTPSRKERIEQIKAEKARAKMARKAWFRAKAEKKLTEKSERKVMHKKANAAQKLQVKLEKKKKEK